MLQPPARDRALRYGGPLMACAHRNSSGIRRTTRLCLRHRRASIRQGQRRSSGSYGTGFTSTRCNPVRALAADGLRPRSHPIRKPATMLPTQQPPWRLSYNVDKLSEAWTFERPVASAAPRPRRFHYGVETPTARASSSVMSPSECAAAYRTRPNALHRDGEFINLLALCEAERHESDDVVRSSNEWRKHWKEQQELQPLPPPSYRDISWPRQLLV